MLCAQRKKENEGLIQLVKKTESNNSEAQLTQKAAQHLRRLKEDNERLTKETSIARSRMMQNEAKLETVEM